MRWYVRSVCSAEHTDAHYGRWRRTSQASADLTPAQNTGTEDGATVGT